MSPLHLVSHVHSKKRRSDHIGSHDSTPGAGPIGKSVGQTTCESPLCDSLLDLFHNPRPEVEESELSKTTFLRKKCGLSSQYVCMYDIYCRHCGTWSGWKWLFFLCQDVCLGVLPFYMRWRTPVFMLHACVRAYKGYYFQPLLFAHDHCLDRFQNEFMYGWSGPFNSYEYVRDFAWTHQQCAGMLADVHIIIPISSIHLEHSMYVLYVNARWYVYIQARSNKLSINRRMQVIHFISVMSMVHDHGQHHGHDHGHEHGHERSHERKCFCATYLSI